MGNDKIENCLSYYYESEIDVTLKCSRCRKGFIPFNGNSICSQEILNCKIGDDHDNQTCSECEEHFYLSNDSLSCIMLSVEDCKSYDMNNNPPVCIECNQGYRILPTNQ